MDIISTYQLRQYEDILAEINSEFEKCEQLKKEAREAEDAITFMKLNLSPCQGRISHVNVKIFGSVSEIENLYDGCNVDVSKCSNCNFFLVEVVLARVVLDKLVAADWKLQIVVKSDNFCLSKTVALCDKSSVMEILAVDDSVSECVVDTYLFHSHENDWIFLDLFSVDVNVSYYFESCKEKQPDSSLVNTLLNINKLYNNDRKIACIRTLPYVQNQFKCGLDKDSFVATVVKNSYHRLNLEAFSEFINDNRRVVELQFCVVNKKVVILYHKDTKIVKLKCCPVLIPMVRNFFEQNQKWDLTEFKVKMKKIKRSEVEEMDLDELVSFYQELRSLWL